jgi:hypothetical protein
MFSGVLLIPETLLPRPADWQPTPDPSTQRGSPAANKAPGGRAARRARSGGVRSGGRALGGVRSGGVRSGGRALGGRALGGRAPWGVCAVGRVLWESYPP